jgi:hypothetical protein
MKWSLHQQIYNYILHSSSASANTLMSEMNDVWAAETESVLMNSYHCKQCSLFLHQSEIVIIWSWQLPDWHFAPIKTNREKPFVYYTGNLIKSYSEIHLDIISFSQILDIQPESSGTDSSCNQAGTETAHLTVLHDTTIVAPFLKSLHSYTTIYK